MRLSEEQFSAENIEPAFFEGERQKIALREALETLQLIGVDNQKIDSLHFNRDFPANPAIIWIGGMFEDVGAMGMRYVGYQLAANNPENPIIVISLPGHGNSDGLNALQHQSIVKNMDLDPVVHSQILAAQSRLKDVGKIVIAGGQSTGARLAPDFASVASQMGIEARAMTGFIMMGVDKRSSMATTAAYIWDGYINQRKYHHTEADKKLDDAMENNFSRPLKELGLNASHNALVNDFRIFKNSPAYLKFVFIDSPLAQDTGFAAIERALDLNPEMLAAIVNGGLDKVSRWRKIEPRATELVKRYDPRLSWDVWSKDCHAMGIASQQPRFAAAVRFIIDSLEF